MNTAQIVLEQTFELVGDLRNDPQQFVGLTRALLGDFRQADADALRTDHLGAADQGAGDDEFVVDQGIRRSIGRCRGLSDYLGRLNQPDQANTRQRDQRELLHRFSLPARTLVALCPQTRKQQC